VAVLAIFSYLGGYRLVIRPKSMASDGIDSFRLKINVTDPIDLHITLCGADRRELATEGSVPATCYAKTF